MNTQDSFQPTLLDLLRPVRLHGWVIVVLVALASGAALGLSLTEKKKYSAVATFQLQDETRDFSVVGVAFVPTQTASALASQAAQTVHDPEVVAHVKRALNSPLQPAQLIADVSAAVDSNANLVHVAATSATATGSADLANTFARAAVNVANKTQRTAFQTAADRLARNKPSKPDVNGSATYNEQLTRLRTLASIATPAQITSVAQPPSSPASPKPARDGAVAGILGLLVGLLVVYVWDSVDRRLRSSREIEANLGYPLVGRVREAALGQTPTTGGRSVDLLDWEQFRILAYNLRSLSPSQAPEVIAVTSAMPEEGKTTVACFTAFANAAAGRRTLLIECDLRRPALAQRLGINAEPGVTDYVTGAASPADILQTVTFTDAAARDGQAIKIHGGQGSVAPEEDGGLQHRVVCITAGSRTEQPAEILESDAFRSMLAQVRLAYDVVICDTPPVLVVVDALEVMAHTDAVVVCGRAAKLTRAQARGGKQALSNVPDQPIGLVVTGLRRAEDEYGWSYYGYYSENRS